MIPCPCTYASASQILQNSRATRTIEVLARPPRALTTPRRALLTSSSPSGPTGPTLPIPSSVPAAAPPSCPEPSARLRPAPLPAPPIPGADATLTVLPAHDSPLSLSPPCDFSRAAARSRVAPTSPLPRPEPALPAPPVPPAPPSLSGRSGYQAAKSSRSVRPRSSSIAYHGVPPVIP